VFTSYIDDGAVFYLNGAEIYRLNMAPAPTPIFNSTLAATYTCPDACASTFIISGEAITNLVSGDNLLAAEVHNYNVQSPDITFGVAMAYTSPYGLPPQLNIQQSGSVLTLSWSRGGFTLQESDSPAGPWINVPGPIVSSPYSTTNNSAPQYFRLMK
jgi:hypothetical protein